MQYLRFRNAAAGAFLLGMISFPAQAVPLVDCPHSGPALVGMQGLIASASANLRALPDALIKKHRRYFTLADGTKISTLAFTNYQNSDIAKPLIIANFGLFSDEYSTSISYFVNSLVLTGKLKADVLIVSSVTSGSFFALNQELGLGGVDEGKILIELKSLYEKDHVNSRPIYLFGVSLGGNAVIQALLEDHRLQQQNFSGAITFSAVVDEEKSSEALFEAFNYPRPELKDGHIGIQGAFAIRETYKQFAHSLVKNNVEVPDDISDAGRFYYEYFTKRLGRLHANITVEKYIHNSSELIHGLDQVKIPLLVMHAKNDPIISVDDFYAFENEQFENKFVFTHATRFGGHWGFLSTYGADWVMQLYERMLSSRAN